MLTGRDRLFHTDSRIFRIRGPHLTLRQVKQMGIIDPVESFLFALPVCLLSLSHHQISVLKMVFSGTPPRCTLPPCRSSFHGPSGARLTPCLSGTQPDDSLGSSLTPW